jgi:uncharacterized NAD(P)/FAD-binding protein YdhS
VALDVLIIGGGFSGTILGVQLLRQSSSLSIGILDRGSAPGRGLAYSSPHRFHLLNVPAGEMSAFPDAPDDFLRWARINFDAGVKERSFLPRSIYGKYVDHLLEKTLADKGRQRFQWLRGEALFIRTRRRIGFLVQTGEGSKILSRTVILAVGNFPPSDPGVPGLELPSPAYFPSPWSPHALDGLSTAENVMLLGSGLTSLDLIMALKSKGFRGTVHVLSRKGLFPHARRRLRPFESWPVFWNKNSPRTARGLLRLVRTQVRTAEELGIDWRAVIDSLRSLTQEIWGSLPIGEQRRFLRHIRVYWDVHRHRVAPEIADLLADMRSEGQVQLHTGVLTRYSSSSKGTEIAFRDHETQAETALAVDRVFNCTGSETDCRRISESLVSSLFAQGLARPDPLFLGLWATKSGRLIDYTGNASRHLYAIGPPLKGMLWETTSVCEIRQQALDLAHRLCACLERDQASNALKTAV